MTARAPANTRAISALTVRLDGLLNNQGATSVGDLEDGAFNVWGNSFPTAYLPEPGEIVQFDGVDLVFSRSDDGADNIRCAGHYIPVEPGQYDWIYVLAAAERRVEDQVALHFAGGAVDVEAFRVSDFWAAEPAYGETVAYDCPVMHYPHHIQPRVPARMWCQRIPVVRRDQLVGIQLPNNVALHVFAMSLVPRAAQSPPGNHRGRNQTLVKTAPGPIQQWYRDPISCLHSTVASILQSHGHDALAVLGMNWRFCFIEDDVRFEEFYIPDPHNDVARALAPESGLRARWRSAPDEGVEPLRQALAYGHLPIAAVDNYYLPFRPAFCDVHAAHLVVVFGVAEAGDQVYVSDAMPPAFQGSVPTSDFLRSWQSANPDDPQDAFFSDSPMAGRWLELDVSRVRSEATAGTVRGALIRNAGAFRTGTVGKVSSGMAGLVAWTERLDAAARDADARFLTDTYVLGWSLQAQAALHGELLRRCGGEWRLPELAVAGRLVERVAASWTGVRATAAHGRLDPVAAAPELAGHARRLVLAHEEALDAVERAAAALARAVAE